MRSGKRNPREAPVSKDGAATDLGFTPGLSQMGQSGQKEFFVPPCFESFATRGSLVWSHFENVCCEAAQERKISGTVILSISGEVFVEYDVLLPMTSVFDVPMLSNDIKEGKWRKAARGNEQPLLVRGFAVDGALGHNPRHGGEALEPMFTGESGCRDDTDRSALMSTVTILGGLSRAGAGPGSIDQSCDRRIEFSLVELEGDDIVTAPLPHRRHRAAVAMAGVCGDNAAIERHPLKKCDHGFHFAALASLGLGERHAHLRTPHRHHHRRHMGAALLIGMLEALAIDGQNGRSATGTKRPAKGLHEADERILKSDRIEEPEHTGESVVARHPVLELQDGAKQSQLVFSELRHLDTGFGSAQHRSKCNKQDLAQVMPSIDVAWVRYSGKYDKEAAHTDVPQNDKDTWKNPSFTESQACFYSHAIPLGFTRVRPLNHMAEVGNIRLRLGRGWG